MARSRNKLTARSAAALVAPGRHSDGGQLYLTIDGQGVSMRRRWLFLFQWNGKRREMGLGGFPAVSLAEARKARDDAERMVREGKDPIAARDLARDELATKPTFGSIADDLIAAKESQWRNEKHRWQWRHTLEVYAATLRTRPVDEVDTAAVLEVLKPLWSEKPETASRLRGRIEAVLDAAKAQGFRSGENPAAWRGHLSHLLPKRKKLYRGHHAAMPYADLPKFVAKLREREAGAALALELCILTAARSGEILGARWSEIDLKEKVWAVPADRMKAGKEHRVPLSPRAVAILEHLAEAKQGDNVFAGQKDKSPLSNMAMVMVLRRMGIKGITVHGFRSAFRDWAGNETAFPREVAEAALAHLIGNDVERAYRRSDALEKRRALMDAWAAWCEPAAGGNVVKFKKSSGNPVA
jgi:integrase